MATAPTDAAAERAANELAPDTILQVASALTITLGPTRKPLIQVGQETLECGSHALAILDTFSRARRFSDGMNVLASRAPGPQDWIDLTSEIVGLYRAGVLVDVTRRTPVLGPRGYSAANIHTRMLNDQRRTAAFLDAVAAVVRPGDVVVDIGTGTGILAIAAAKAGARHIYAVEASDIARTARAMFDHNRVSDRVTLVEGWSTRVELPERADVLLSEMIGDEPLGENILEITADARRRLLKPDARYVPSRLRLYALPLSLPVDRVAEHTFTEAAVRDWERSYGMSFAALRATSFAAAPTFKIKPQDARDWQALGPPVLLQEFDLSVAAGTAVQATATGTIDSDGELSGVMVYFEIDLADGVSLSVSPGEASATNHWQNPVWVVPDSRRFRAGETYTVSYVRYSAGSTRLSLTDA